MGPVGDPARARRELLGPGVVAIDQNVGMSARAEQFDLLPMSVQRRWANFLEWEDQQYFPQLVGMQVEELRRDVEGLRGIAGQQGFGEGELTPLPEGLRKKSK